VVWSGKLVGLSVTPEVRHSRSEQSSGSQHRRTRQRHPGPRGLGDEWELTRVHFCQIHRWDIQQNRGYGAGAMFI